MLDNIQKQGLGFVEKNPKALINLPVGHGKTRIISEYLRQQDDRTYWIILCPKSIVGQWVKEFEREGVIDKVKDLPGMIWLELPGEIYVHICSQHSVTKLAELTKARGWIIDEPKMLKSKTKFWEYLTHRIYSGRKILLDATVLENNYDELEYLSEFFGLSHPSKLKQITFSPDTSPLRKIERKILRVDLFDKKNKIVAKGLEKNMLAMLKSTKAPLLARYNAIREALNYLSEFPGPGEEKLEALVQFLRNETSPRRRGVVFTRSLTSVDHLVRSLGRFWPTARVIGSLSGKAREEIKEKFNRGEIDWIVATKAGERGIDLFSGNTVIHFDLPFSQSSYIQRDRVTRRSSDLSDKTSIITMIIKNSLEELQLTHIKCKIQMDKNVREGKLDFVPRESWTKFLEEKHEKIAAKKQEKKNNEQQFKV